MINGLGVLGYGVGGIEAEAVLLGQPLYQPMPTSSACGSTGELPQGSTATDLVLVVTEMLRRHGVVGAFVEFAGDGLAGLSLADRATISNMSPEFGATATLFPIDDETLAYLRLTGRRPSAVALVERYAKEQGLWREPGDGPTSTRRSTLDLGDGRAVRGRPAATPGPRPLTGPARQLPDELPGRARRPIGGRRRGEGVVEEASGRVVPGQRPAVVRASRAGRRPARRPRSRRTPAATTATARSRSRSTASGHDPHRLGRHRRDHVLHQHVQPDGHGRRRAARPERRRPRLTRRADGQDLPRARLAGGHRVPRGGRA